MSGNLNELTRTGRLANVLCSLAGSGFTGLVYAEREAESLVISVRDGSPVFVEDLGETKSISDVLLEQGLLTKEQYAEVATRVIESLAENEDAAFCQVAVQLRFLTQGQVDSAVERRVRGRLIQCVAWEHCRVEIDDDPDGLTGTLEYPQPIGSLIYMGVRTFFDEDRVRSLLGGETELYVRPLRPVVEVVAFFQLESEEAGLLSQLRPDVSVSSTIEQSAGDTLEGWQLLSMLVLAGMVEIGPSPFAATTEPSGVRSAQSLEGGSATAETRRGSASQAQIQAAVEQPATSGSQARIQAAREERAVPGSRPRMPIARGETPMRSASQARVPVPREEPETPGSQARMQAVREERVSPASRPHMPVAREAPPRSASHTSMPATREPQGSPAQSSARMPAAKAASPAPGSRPNVPAARAESAARGSELRTPTARGESSSTTGRDPGRSSSGQTPDRAASAPHAGSSQSAVAATESQIASRLQGRKRPTRKLSTALQRLDRELKQARKHAPEEPAAEPAAGGHGRAHVDQLIRMRHATMAQKQIESRADGSKLGEESFRAGQDALRENKFARAHDLLRKACDTDPNNEVYSMFCLWAALRAGTLQEEGLSKLRTLLRNRVTDDQYKGFAYYALGHVALVEKKDEAAEKFFRRAIELDKNNKDAERHLRVIELRRKTAATEHRGNKIFGIEIGTKKS